MKIIGIGGLPRSGKDTLAEVFIKNGYFGVSLGDIIRNIAKIRHKNKSDSISVANMTETSNYLRSERGADFAIKEAIQLFNSASQDDSYKGLVVFSIRAPVEVDKILTEKGELIWIETDDEVRLRRFHESLREGEAKISLKEQKAQEVLQSKPQSGLPVEVQMNTDYVKSKATITIDNNFSSVVEFQKNAEKVLSKYLD